MWREFSREFLDPFFFVGRKAGGGGGGEAPDAPGSVTGKKSNSRSRVCDRKSVISLTYLEFHVDYTFQVACREKGHIK